MKTLIAALLLATLTGCASYGHDQRVAAANAHPEWTADQRADALSGQIRVGMTKEQVLVAWGQPCNLCRGTRSTSAGDWWEYNPYWPHKWHHGAGTYLFFGTDGKLRYWGGP